MGGQRVGIDRNGRAESGDRQEEEWVGEGEIGDRVGWEGESGDRQEWKGGERVGIDRSGRAESGDRQEWEGRELG